MARGRKRKKNVARTKGGRISRAKPFRIEPTYDKGTERAQAIQALYGQNGSDAIGRAYEAGFLGHGNEAKALLDKARSVSNAYWSAYAVGAIRKSSTADNDNGSTAEPDHDRIKEREDRLREDLQTVARMGMPYRRAFDQLVVDVNPDCGPSWLDDMLRKEALLKAIGLAEAGELEKAKKKARNLGGAAVFAVSSNEAVSKADFMEVLWEECAGIDVLTGEHALRKAIEALENIA